MDVKKLTIALALLSLLVTTASAQQRPRRGGNNAAVPNASGASDPNTQFEIPPIQEEGEFYVLNFSEDPGQTVTLEDFVKLCQEATQKNFTYSDETQSQLGGKNVRMFGMKRIPKDDFYRFFQIMMFIHDFVTVEVGPRHLTVVVIQSLTGSGAQRQNIKQKTLYVLPEELDEYKDQPAVLITTVLNLPNLDVRQIPTTLRPLISDQTTQNLLAVGNSNSLLLTGFGSQVASWAKLLRFVDERSADEENAGPVFDTIPLEFASANEVADLINQLLGARSQGQRTSNRQRNPQGDAGGGQFSAEFEPEILVDARTNSLILMALPEDLPHIKELVARLDVDVVEPERTYRIFNLENVQAEDIAGVLDDFLRDAARIQENGGTAQGGRAQASTGSSNNQNEVVVVPEPNTNSLLIAASKTRYEEVLEILQQLDTRQDQVLIEMALVELTGSDLFNFTVDLLGSTDVPTNDQEDLGFFGSSNLISEDVDLNATTLNGFVPGGFSAGIIDFDEFTNNPFLPFLITTLETQTNSNILSVPSVLVNNNGTARVVTQDEQPFTQVTATGQGQSQQNFQGYQEAGIDLSISPSISASRYLRLGISLIISNFGARPDDLDSSIPPPRTTREIHTSVNVPDGSTMVVGGIVSDNQNDTVRKVPLLGDIPLLGHLFRSTSNQSTKTTLYFFVTPYIMRDIEFADLAEFSYIKKLEAAEIIGSDRVQVVDPTFGEVTDNYDLESFELPQYSPPQRGEIESEAIGMDPLRRNELIRDSQDSPNEAGSEGETSAMPESPVTPEVVAPAGDDPADIE